MNPLDLLPLPYRIAIIAFLAMCAAAAIFGYGHHKQLAGLAQGRAEVKAEWNAERAKQAADALAQAQANAKETQRRLERQQEAQREYDAQLAQARHDADAANAALDGLRRRANQYAAAARRAASNPAAVANSTPASDPSGVLADVLGKLGGRAQLLASYADAARRAGKQCEAAYDTLSEALDRKH